MKQKKWREWMHRSLDDELTPKEKEEWERALAGSPELREAYQALMQTQTLLSKQEFRFQPFFSGKVMHRIEQLRPIPKQIANWGLAFRTVAIPGLVAIVLLLITTWVTHGSFSVDALAGVYELAPEDLLADYFSQ